MAENTKPTAELGVAGSRYKQDQLWSEEFIQQLRGVRGMRQYREMRENDPLIGGILSAVTLLVRSGKLRVVSADETNPQAEEAKEFAESIFDDMHSTFESFAEEALTFLPFGFSLFEIVYKRRNGRDGDPSSKFDDGAWGIHKLAPRAQWTIERFVTDDYGDVISVEQLAGVGMRPFVSLPIEKCLHLRTSTTNREPAGRSILRNAYVPYYYATNIERMEATAIEREWNGIPIARIPAAYLQADADSAYAAVLDSLKNSLRDLKLNEQSYLIIPSDTYQDGEGNPTNTRKIEVELMSSSGTRAIDTGGAITRHRTNIARAMLADFMMLGQSERGSFAMSKSKTDLFLAAANGYTRTIAKGLERQVLTRLWRMNGFDFDVMPSLQFDDVAPQDIEELGAFLRDAASAGFIFGGDQDTEEYIRDAAGLPERQDEDPDLLGRPVQDEMEQDLDETAE